MKNRTEYLLNFGSAKIAALCVVIFSLFIPPLPSATKHDAEAGFNMIAESLRHTIEPRVEVVGD